MSVQNDDGSGNSQSQEPTKLTPELVERLHRALTPELREYWNKRYITDDTISNFKLGYGRFYGRWWLTIPIMNENGDWLYLKLKAPPDDPKREPRSITWPTQKIDPRVEPMLYPLPYLTPAVSEIFIAEGEPDCLLLLSFGVEAVTSTHGAGTFEPEWVQRFPANCRVVLGYDADDAGKKARERVSGFFREQRPDIHLGNVVFPKQMIDAGGKDITDLFRFVEQLGQDCISSPPQP